MYQRIMDIGHRPPMPRGMVTVVMFMLTLEQGFVKPLARLR